MLTAPGPSGVRSGLLQTDSWPGPRPMLSAVISTYRRPRYLADLLGTLERQDLSSDVFEVVVVDNGSGDGTWPLLEKAVMTSRLRMSAVRLDDNRGPGGGRNAGVAVARADLLAFTDDDCLPTPGWLSELIDAFSEGIDLVQGQVAPEPEGWDSVGPWDHTVRVAGLTPWGETSNVAYRRRAFDAVGGFDEEDRLTSQGRGGRAFGEDALLAWGVVRAGGGRCYAPDAVVHHRVIPKSYWSLVKEWRNCNGFPGLAARSGLVADSLIQGVFLSRDTAEFDLAVAGVVVAVVTRRPAMLGAALPWLRRTAYAARSLGQRPMLGHVARRALLEGVGLISLLEGSVRYRRLVM